MELKYKIKKLKADKKYFLLRAEDLENEIIKYENLTSITTPLLVKELSEIEALNKLSTKGLEINVYKGTLNSNESSAFNVEEIKIEGVICDVESTYYLTNIQKNLVSEYLKSLGEINEINFK